MPELLLKRSDDPALILLAPHTSILIGTEKHCIIRLQTGPPIAGRIDVIKEDPPRRDREARHKFPVRIFYTPFWPDEFGHPREDSDAKAELEAGNTLQYDSLTLSITEPEPSHRQPGFLSWLYDSASRLDRFVFPVNRLSSRERSRRKAEQGLLASPEGRKRLMARLATIIQDSEAAAVRTILNRSKAAFTIALLATVACLPVLLHLVPASVSARSSIALIVMLSALLVAMLVSSLFFAPVNAILLTAAGVAGGLLSVEDPEQSLLAAGAGAAIGLWVGRACDSFWSPIPSDKRSERGVLIGYFGGIALFLTIEEPDLGLPTKLLAAALGVIFLFWGFWIVPRLQIAFLDGRIRSPGAIVIPKASVSDVLTHLEIAWGRWCRLMVFRLVALLLAALPLLAVLNSWDIRRQRLPLLLGDANEGIKVWTEKGVLVSSELLATRRFYVIDDHLWKGDQDLIRRLPFWGLAFADAEGAFLPQLRLRHPDELDKLQAPGAECWVATARQRDETTGRAYVVLNRATIWNTSRSEIARRTLISRLLAPSGLLFTFLGFLILWRGPGFGPAVIVAALWAFGAGAVAIYAPVMVFDIGLDPVVSLHELRFQLEQVAFHSPLALLCLGLGFLLVTVLHLLAFGTLIGLFPGLLFYLLHFQRNPNSPTQSVESKAVRVVKATGFVFSVAFLASACYMYLRSAWWALALSFLPFLVAWLVTKRRKAITGAGGSLLLLLILPGLFLGAGSYALQAENAAFLVLAISALTLIQAAALIDLVVIRKLWNLANGKATGTILVTLILPLLLTILKWGLGDLALRSRLLPASAVDLAGLLLFLFFFRSLDTRSDELAERLVLRRMRRAVSLQRFIIDRLERCDGAPARHQEVKRVLTSPPFELPHFAFYSNRGHARSAFERLASSFREYIPPFLHLSEGILSDLAGPNRLLRATEWIDETDHVMTAPELWRIQRSLGKLSTAVLPSADKSTDSWKCEYILPVTRAATVVGLLIVGGALDESARSDAFGRYLNEVCLAAL